MAKKKQPLTDLEKYKNAATYVARLTDQIKQLKKELDDINADPMSFLDPKSIEAQIKSTEEVLKTALERQQKYVKAYEDEQFRIKEAELQKEGQLERALLQKMLKDKADAEAKATADAAAEALRAAKESARQQAAIEQAAMAESEAIPEQEGDYEAKTAKAMEAAAKRYDAEVATAEKAAAEVAKAENDKEKLRAAQYAAATKAMNAYYAEEEAQAKQAAKVVAALFDTRSNDKLAAEQAKKEEQARKEAEAANKKAWADQAGLMRANFEEEQRQNAEKAKAAERAAKEVAKQLADVRKQAEADQAAAEKMQRDQYAAAASAMRKYQQEEEAERKRAQKEKASALAEELKQIKDTADARKRAAQEFQSLAKELFWTARYGGISGLAMMGASRLASRVIQGPEAPPVVTPAPTARAGGKTPDATGLISAGQGGEAGMGAGGGAVLGVSLLAGAAIGAAKGLVDFTKQTYALAVQLSSLVAPGVTARHERATEDMWASIGVMLLPIVEHATNILDKFNALFTSLQGRVTPVVEKLASALESLFDAGIKLVMLLDSQGPTLEKIGAALASGAEQVIYFADAMLRGTAIILEFFDRVQQGNVGALDFADIVRAAEARINALPSDRTIAARQAQFTTIEGVGEAARLAAFSARATAVAQLDESRRQTGLLQGIFDNTRPAGSSGGRPTGNTGINGLYEAARNFGGTVGGMVGGFIWP